MKPKKALIVSIAFLIVLLLLSGCRRLNRQSAQSSQTNGISMASETSWQPSTSSTTTSAANENGTEPADKSEIDDTLDQILSELAGLDSLYTQMDDVTEADLNN